MPWGLAALVALAVLWFASRIPRTLTIFVIAAFIAFGVHPIVLWLERYVHRHVALLVVYLGLIGSLVAIVFLVVPATVQEIEIVAGSVPEYLIGFDRWIDGLQDSVRTRFGPTALPKGSTDIKVFLTERISTLVSATVNSLTDVLINTVTAAVVAISALILSAFFLLRGETIAGSLYGLIPEPRRATARALGSELADVFSGFIAGQTALCAIVGALIFAFAVFVGFKFALLLGILSAVAYAVPFFGMLVIHVVALILAAPQGTRTMIWVTIIVFVVARVADGVLVPKIMSDRVGISPIVVMFAVFAGGELFGLPGLLLGIPAAALGNVAWKFYRGPTQSPTAPMPAELPTATEPVRSDR